MFEATGKHVWVTHLDDLIENYNTQVNRGIGIKPMDVTVENKFTIWGRLFGQVMEIKEPKFKVGDKVRVLKFRPDFKGVKFQKYFREKYPPKISKITGKPINEHMLEVRDKSPFSEEIFVIHEVLLGDPVVYKLYSEGASMEILGKFYEDELSLVR